MTNYEAIKYHIKQTIIELQLLGKSKKEAKSIIYDKTNYQGILNRHPLALHDSPHQWALTLLTKVNDWNILNKYYNKGDKINGINNQGQGGNQM